LVDSSVRPGIVGNPCRTWLVLSAIWIGLVISVETPSAFYGVWKASQFEVTFSTGARVFLDSTQRRSDLMVMLNEFMKREDLEDLAKRDEILAEINARSELAGERARRAWLAAFGPPLALLCLGLAVTGILGRSRLRARGLPRVRA
jgi:hypothetical protein